MDLNDNHADDGIIEDARMNAATQWEEEFISAIKARRKRFGATFILSDRERAIVLKMGGNGD